MKLETLQEIETYTEIVNDYLKIKKLLAGSNTYIKARSLARRNINLHQARTFIKQMDRDRKKIIDRLEKNIEQLNSCSQDIPYKIKANRILEDAKNVLAILKQ